MKAFLLLTLLLCSCVQYQDMYQNKYSSLGGDADVTFPGGGHLTHSHTASFQHFTQMVTTVAGSLAVSAVSKAATASNNALKATKDTNATNLGITNSNNAAAEAAGANNLKTTQAGLNAGVFTPAATQFKQP